MSSKANKRNGKRKSGSSAARKKARRRRTIIKLLRDLILIGLIVLIAICGYYYFYDVFADEPVAESEEDAVEVTVRVDSGMSDMQVARMLEQNGLVKSSLVFFGQSKIFKDSGSSIQPGTYKLNTYMTAQEMLEILTAEDEEDEADASGDSSE